MYVNMCVWGGGGKLCTCVCRGWGVCLEGDVGGMLGEGYVCVDGWKRGVFEYVCVHWGGDYVCECVCGVGLGGGGGGQGMLYASVVFFLLSTSSDGHYQRVVCHSVWGPVSVYLS